MLEALVAYLEKRQAKWQPDLVVPYRNSPAGVFVAQYRERLFPRTTILYAGMDRRRLPPDAYKRMPRSWGKFQPAGFVEDILQLKPDTTTTSSAVIGASQVERYWAAAFQSEFAPFTIWLASPG